MFDKVKFIVVGLICLALLSLFITSCDLKKHHKISTFFFDGVPPLEAKTIDALEGTAKSDALESQSRQPQKRPEDIWFVHKPNGDCNFCHGRRKQRSFTRRVSLPVSVPELCYKCHSDYSVSGGYVHGPVAVGQCLFCHEPHRTRIAALLKKPVPKLCYDCHDRKAIDVIPSHSTDSLPGCTNCHEAHASSLKSLLKDGLER